MKDTSCQKEACDLQKCLQLRDYDQERCKEYVKALSDCCTKAQMKRLQLNSSKMDIEFVNCGLSEKTIR
jgi:hypothetical protein